MYGTIQVKINVPDEVRDYLVYQCRQSNSLLNSTIYHVKQKHFEDCPRSEFFTGDEFGTGFKLQRVKTAKYADLCLQMKGKSFIVDGRKLKSINQQYNKRVATLKEGSSQGFWNEQLAALTEKRNRVMRDAIHKTARFIVNHCLENRIGAIVFGWNQRQKDGSDMGRCNNKTFVQISTGRLKTRLQQLCETVGIRFLETEESYTSKASFFDGDFLPRFGEKPKSWKPSGKREKRGQYKTARGHLINADCNGAANILRKVAIQLGISLVKVGRAALNLPKRYELFGCLKKSYRKRCAVAILSPVATSA